MNKLIIMAIGLLVTTTNAIGAASYGVILINKSGDSIYLSKMWVSAFSIPSPDGEPLMACFDSRESRHNVHIENNKRLRIQCEAKARKWRRRITVQFTCKNQPKVTSGVREITWPQNRNWYKRNYLKDHNNHTIILKESDCTTVMLKPV